MAAISELIHWLSGDSVAPVAPSKNLGATLEPAKTLGVAPVARKKADRGAKPCWPAVWYVEVGDKRVTMIDFDHTPAAGIERQLRNRFGSRLSHFELKTLEE